MMQWTWGCGYVYKLVSLFPLEIHLEVKLLDHMVGSSIFNFLRTIHTVFQGGCTNLYSYQGAQSTLFSMSLPTLIISYLLIIAILICMRWHLIALICFSLIISDIEHFHVPVGQLHVFLEKCLNLLPFFLIKLFFCYWIPSSSLHTSYNRSKISFSISRNIFFCVK